MGSFVLLVVTVVVPVFIVMVVVFSLCSDGESLKQKLQSIFELHVEEGLIRQGLLWIAIGVPLGLGFSFGLWSWSEYRVELSSAGFKKFLEISLLPLAIMSISLPLAGLVTRLHSTQQAARQIFLSKFKNNIDAFYSHRKAMLEYFKEIPSIKYFDEYEFVFSQHPVLHKRFFNGTPEDGWPTLNNVIFNEISDKIVSAARSLQVVLSGGRSELLSLYLAACVDVYLVAKVLNIKEVTHVMARRGVYVKYQNSSGGSLTLGVSTLEMLAAIRFVREYYNNLCDFSGRERLVMPLELENVFNLTEHWLDRGRFIEYLHSNEIDQLVRRKEASYSDNHEKKVREEWGEDYGPRQGKVEQGDGV